MASDSSKQPGPDNAKPDPTPGEPSRPQSQRSGDGPGGLPNLSEAATGDESTTQGAPSSEREGRLGPYRILEQIGQGGMGAVYKAEQLEPVKRIVAIKRIKPGFDTTTVIARFESERQALARMDHPHIAKVLDAGTDRFGRPYFVMEFVPGAPIVEFADRNRLSITQRLELFLQVCEAIAHAHTKAMIHRDIKSTNVLAYMADGKPFVKVIDFGVAKALSGEKLTDRTLNTQMGAVIGTYGYMSPEQASGSADIDTRTDVYSLGVLLYELLAGSQPFDAKMLRQAAEEEIRRIIREVEPPRPSTKFSSLGDEAENVARARDTSPQTLRRELTSELDWIPLMAMRKERERRYVSALDLAQDIRSYLEHHPLKARPDSVWYRTRKMVRRNRAALATTAACIVFSLLMVAIVTWRIGVEKSRVSEERGRKEAAEVLAQKQSDRLKGFQDALAKTRERADELGKMAAQAQDAIDKADSELARGAIEGRAERLAIQAERAVAEVNALEASMRGAQRLADVLDGKASTAKPIDSARVASFFNMKYGFCSVPDPPPLPGVEFWGIELRHARAGANCVSFSPDGRHFVTGGNDVQVRVWDAQTCSQSKCFFSHISAVQAIAYSPDGSHIASGGEDSGIRIWDVASGRIVHLLEGHGGPIMRVRWSPDGTRLVSCSLDNTIRIWDFKRGELIQIIDGSRSRVCSVAWSPDGRRLASFSGDGKLRLWNVSTGEELAQVPDPEINPSWTSTLYLKVDVAWSPDGKTIAWSHQGQVRRLDADTFSESAPIALELPAQLAANIIWSPNGQSIACTTGGISIFQAQTGELLQTVPKQAAGVAAADWSPDGTTLVFVDHFGGVHLWSVKEKKMIRSTPGTPACPQMSAWSPDGSLLACSSLGTGVTIRDFKTMKTVGKLKGLTGQIAGIDWSARGNLIACRGRWSNDVIVFDAKSESEVTRTKIDSQGMMGKLAWSPDGEKLIVPGTLGTFAVWRPRSSEPVVVLGDGKAQIRQFAWFPDSNTVAVGGEIEGIEIWDISRQARLHTLTGHIGRISALASSPDGKTLASSSLDRTIRLWNPADGRLIDILRGHRDRVVTLHWSADGRELTSSGASSSVRVWNATWGSLISSNNAPFIRATFSRDGAYAAQSEINLIILDTRTKACIDQVLTLHDGSSLFVGPHGHYDGPPGIEKELVYVIRTEKGQETLTPEEFSKRFNWKNDPARAHREAWIAALPRAE